MPVQHFEDGLQEAHDLGEGEAVDRAKMGTAARGTLMAPGPARCPGAAGSGSGRSRSGACRPTGLPAPLLR